MSRLGKTKHIWMAVGYAVCMFACLIWIVPLGVGNAWEKAAIEKAAIKLSVAPTYDGLADHIRISIKPKMSKVQVEDILRSIAPTSKSVFPDVACGRGCTVCDTIYLRLNPLPDRWWPISACYRDGGWLVRLVSCGKTGNVWPCPAPRSGLALGGVWLTGPDFPVFDIVSDDKLDWQ